MQKVGAQLSFHASEMGKPALLAKTQVETLTINTKFPHLEFLVQNWSSSRGRLWSFGKVSIYSLIFYGIFLSLVIWF
jgi:hypothetical protein